MKGNNLKSFTSMEQSRALEGILPPESADMAYLASATDEEGEPLYTADYKSEVIIKESDEYVNCWSLAALLSLLPRPTLHQTNDGKWYCDITDNKTYFSKHYDNSVDACVEMVLKLKELNLLK